MNKSTRFEPTQVLPGVVLGLRQVKPRIRDIPAIAELVGEQRYQLGEDCDCISMARTPYVASNPDDTLELISPVQFIKPDIEGSPAIYVSATEIERRPDSLGAIELLRSHLVVIDANRKSISDAELLKLIFEGQIDSVLELFLRGRSIETRGLLAVLSTFGEGRFKPETYYRHKRSDETTDDGDSEPSASDEESPAEEMPTEVQPPKETTKPPITPPTNDSNSCAQENEDEHQSQQPDLFPKTLPGKPGETPDSGSTSDS